MIPMRFERGRLVEVLTKKKVPSGVWRCAEIVSDNGDGYMVRYYRNHDIYKEGVDKVSVDVVRPCPPSTGSVVWAVGDVAEVLDGGYWKVSVIEEDFGDDFYQIRVVGSLHEFRVHKSNIRMRQEWKNNTWISLGKDSGNCEDLMMRIRRKGLLQQQGNSACMQKRRTIKTDVELNAIHHDSYSFIGNADPPNSLKQLQSTNTDTMFHTRTSELNDCVSAISSVASCSILYPLADRVLNHPSTSFSQDDDSLCSDAESCNPWGDEEANIIGEFRAALDTHELDLCYYRCFLEALYASGPLSWEQEILLTNTRMKLFVSNDEHLMELKRLKYIGGAALRSH